jgi:aryl-alcohol dehydrogenase-like predicted oxidoreductase
VCEDFSCRRPVTTPEGLSEIIDESLARRRAGRTTELGARIIAGRATTEATQRWAKSHAEFSSGFSRLGELTVSRVGLGTHRVGLDAPEHQAATLAALSSGVNLVDTSPTFAFGDSERLLGLVIGELVEAQKLAREQLVVITKVGVALGAAAEGLQQRRSGEAPPVATCALSPSAEASSSEGESLQGESLQGGAFSLDPDYIRSQIASSLGRLRLQHADICVVQSPEHFLAAGRDRGAFDSAMKQAFSTLEAEVEAGRIGRYGVLTNTASRAEDDPLFVSIEHLVELARQVRGEQHHFSVLEIPVNVVESSALGKRDGSSLVDRANELGLSVLATRPLSPFVSGALLRLVDPPQSQVNDPAAALRAARYRVSAMEAEFETTFAAQLRLTGRVGPGQVLPMSGPLGRALEQAATREQFRLAETTMITPQLRQLLGQLDRALSGPGEAKWHSFRDKYEQAVGVYLAAIHESATEKNRALLAEIDAAAKADDVLALPEKTGAPWARRALLAVAHAPGITSALVGLRTTEQVTQTLALAQSR